MKNVSLNVAVACVDGLGGQTSAIIVNPQTLQISGIVVEEPEPPNTRRLVPVEHVTESTADLVRLDCTTAQLAEMDDFTVTEFQQMEIPTYSGADYMSSYYYPEIVTVAIEHEQVPEGKIAVHQGDLVQATDGPVGTVESLVADGESGKLSHFVLRSGVLWEKKDVLMPVSMVDYVDHSTIYLKIDKETLATLLAVPVKQRRGALDIELFIVTFEAETQAAEALAGLKKLVKSEQLAFLNAAVLQKDAGGKTLLKEVEDVNPRQGALFGAITGGLIGLLAGPVGAVVGAAAGAATGSAAANRIDMGFPDDYLRQLQKNMAPGSSALVLLVEQAHAKAAVAAVDKLGGHLLRQTLTEDVVTQLSPGA